MIDARLLPLPTITDTPERLKEKVAKFEKHFHKLGARNRREAALVGKAGRKPEPETVELHQSHFVEGKPWAERFKQLWAAPRRKAPVMHDRTKVESHLRKRVKAYAAARRRAESSRLAD